MLHAIPSAARPCHQDTALATLAIADITGLGRHGLFRAHARHLSGTDGRPLAFHDALITAGTSATARTKINATHTPVGVIVECETSCCTCLLRLRTPLCIRRGALPRSSEGAPRYNAHPDPKQARRMLLARQRFLWRRHTSWCRMPCLATRCENQTGRTCARCCRRTAPRPSRIRLHRTRTRE